MSRYAPLPLLSFTTEKDDGAASLYSDASKVPSSPSPVSSCFTDGEETDFDYGRASGAKWTRLQGNHESKAAAMTWSQAAYEASSNAGKAILQAGLHMTDLATKSVVVPATGGDKQYFQPPPPRRQGSSSSTCSSASSKSSSSSHQSGDKIEGTWSAYVQDLALRFTAPKTNKIKLH